MLLFYVLVDADDLVDYLECYQEEGALMDLQGALMVCDVVWTLNSPLYE